MLKLYVVEVTDKPSQDNFRRIEQEFRDQKILRGGWKFFEITFSAATTNFRYPHKMTMTPKDVIQTRITGTGALTWNYARFDQDFLDITTTGPCSVRAFIGTFAEGGS
jgi:hypothetical protein